MRLISFSLTKQQFLAGTKDITRRLGWRRLRPGDHLMAVRKAQGLKKGQHPELLGEIKVVSMRREGLTEIDADDCRREGFPELSPEEFVEMFCKHMGCEPQTEVTRIEFRKVKAAR